MKNTKLSRGERNNNPLNIRRTGAAWYGLCRVQTDRAFCQFVSMTYGLRAAFVILHTYMTKYKLCTIEGIVSRWAPKSDNNNTDAYIASVAKRMGIGRDAPIDWHDKETMVALVGAMAVVECGRAIQESLIAEGYDLAKKSHSD